MLWRILEGQSITALLAKLNLTSNYQIQKEGSGKSSKWFLSLIFWHLCLNSYYAALFQRCLFWHTFAAVVFLGLCLVIFDQKDCLIKFSWKLLFAFQFKLDARLYIYWLQVFGTEATKTMVNWFYPTMLQFSAQVWKAYIIQAFTCKQKYNSWILFYFIFYGT